MTIQTMDIPWLSIIVFLPLLGTLKTGDDITINFEVVMTNQTADTVN